MAKLKINNIGPIKNTSNFKNEYIEFDGVTVFIGNQGAGKSTISKIYSTLAWIEKALVRGDFNINYISQYNRFKKQLAYQNIGNYLNDDSYIDYIGKAYQIIYRNGKVEVIENLDKDSEYLFPKIMYVPAERNFVSTVERPDLVKRLPLPLYTFLEEYEYAKQNLSETITLPIGNIKFEYRKQNKKSWLIGEDYKIDLLEASSGYQSLVPLFLVTNSLSKIISNENNASFKERNVVDENKIRNQIDKIFSNDKISEDIKTLLLEKLSSKYKYSSFINVVEEPEQNLYPTSQKGILFSLFSNKNKNDLNKLIITTHSPYIINHLTLAIKAFMVKPTIDDSLFGELNDIVPLDAAINPSTVNIYQLDESGNIEKLDNYKGLPSDENFLNEFLGAFNDDFVKLLEIEKKCQ
ncbi:ATP-binding protein [Flavobacterium psychrophilum]|uniref:AAA family ATPase n=1 Tax=Flavobacterium psychrophilum TaxID=96345 RepID=UPI00106AB8E9|nr:AAA family ATPase [Flavobacterium psychrophilum]MCB6230575.1 ATP-binding protein [Flavobacterium psychrophilum]